MEVTPTPEAPPVDLSVVVVGYGAPDLLERCLESLQGVGQPRRTTEVVLLDNASPVPLRESLGCLGRRRDDAAPPLRFVELEHNVGFGSACNHGARTARGRVVVFLNPDAEALPGALDALVDFLDADPRRGVVGGRTLSPGGHLDPRSAWGDPTLWSELCFATGLSTVFKGSRLFDREAMAWWRRDTVSEVGVVTGCLLGVDRRVFLDVLRGFPTDVFMYGEDVILSRAARRAGYRPAITPDATVVHVGGGTSTSVAKLLMVLKGKASVYRRGVGPVRRSVSTALLQAGVAMRAGREAAQRSGDDRWRQAWRWRGAWRTGWTAADVPPVVERVGA